MFGHSRISHQVFKLPESATADLDCALEISFQIEAQHTVSANAWKRVRALQGILASAYLRLRYGSNDTYLLWGQVGSDPAHVAWIVPTEKLRARYPFLPPQHHAVIACVTAERYRGQRVYPAALQAISDSEIPTRGYWIWAAESNVASLSGIRRAGGGRVGSCVQEKWLWGCFSRVRYQALSEDSA